MRRHIMKSILSSVLVISGLIGGGALVAAQELEDSTVAGCLQPGAKEGEFMLVADDKQTYHVEPAEGVELAPHSNHRVELTGTIEKSETQAVVKTKAVKMVAASCEG